MEPTSTSASSVGDTALTEAEFLKQEADDAKTAALRAIGELNPKSPPASIRADGSRITPG